MSAQCTGKVPKTEVLRLLSAFCSRGVSAIAGWAGGGRQGAEPGKRNQEVEDGREGEKQVLGGPQ